MGGIVDKAISVGTLGLAKDASGTKAAGKAARAGQAGALAAEERMQEKQHKFLTEQRDRQEGQITDLTGVAKGEAQQAAQQRQGYLSEGFGAAQQTLGGLSSLYQPSHQAGQQALGQMQGIAGQDINVQKYLDPSMQFQMEQGTKAIEGSAAARGMQLSSGNLKNISKFSQGLASQEYGKAFQRGMADRQQTLGALGQVGAFGMQGTAGMAGGMQGMANLQQGQGSAMAQTAYDPSALTTNQMSMMTGVGSQYTQGVNQSLSSLGQSQSQYHQNMGQLGASQATAGWNQLMGLGQLAVGGMSAMSGFSGGGSPQTPMAMNITPQSYMGGIA